MKRRAKTAFDSILQENMELFFDSEPAGTANTVTKKSRRHSFSSVLGTLVLVGGLFTISETYGILAKGSEPTINLNVLPAKLPKAVSKRIASVGKITASLTNSLNPHQKNLGRMNYGETASGVEISPNLILTAGHVVMANLSNASDVPGQCESLYFETADRAYYADYAYGRFSFNFASNTPDFAVSTLDLEDIRAFNTQDTHAPSLQIASEKPKLGQELYFVNYQPTANNLERDPQTTGPAIFGGIYIGNINNSYEVLTGLKSYGSINDSSTRPGSSGGAVFNAHGELVGLSVRGSNGTSTVSSFANNFKERLGGLNPQERVTDAIVQPVNDKLILNDLENLHPMGC